jgi:hypothetical protein
MKEDIHISSVPSAEKLKEFPGLIALQAIYENYVRDCAKCDLHKTRTKVVFGTGNSETPDIAFLGEAPGAEEDESGFPFVGKSGKLVTKIIEAMGYAREEVYIFNTVCCRPPDNRNPDKDEIDACSANMRSQRDTISSTAKFGSHHAPGGLRGFIFLHLNSSSFEFVA